MRSKRCFVFGPLIHIIIIIIMIIVIMTIIIYTLIVRFGLILQGHLPTTAHLIQQITLTILSNFNPI